MNPSGGELETRPAVRIEVLHVPSCTRVHRVRALIDRALIATGVTGTVKEIVGDYASPTVLVNGVDVTGRSPEPGLSCRLDLPTEAQLGDALTRASAASFQ